ncbi:MAG: cytochrome c oxidase subunit [Phycisphaerales bacterium]|jgi:cytochrome c oxidase subunit 3|nr:cytochrome c oxidase subunit [Phycisphaerales bacterium]
MSDLLSKQQAAVAKAGDTSAPERDHHHHPHGNVHLAHHFETPEQQFNSAKIGMWVFLATELLMFGGLFCAYAVYRHNHPEVFEFGHTFLNKNLGAINTIFLISSSLTMAWGVRAAQLGARRTLVACLTLTLIGGAAFMVIKTIEYSHKYHENVWFGSGNKFSKIYKPGVVVGPGGGHGSSERPHVLTETEREHAAEVHEQATTTQPTAVIGDPWVDPNAGTGDEAKIKPTQIVPVGLAPRRATPGRHDIKFEDLPQLEKERVATFFNIYFLMTGLHGVHVLVGMALIYWILVRATSPHLHGVIIGIAPLAVAAYLFWLGSLTHGHLTIPGWRTFENGMWWLSSVVALIGVALIVRGVVRARTARRGRGEFGPRYYTPVDLVGLYWHLVDLIWIFLFPLLYLIH